MGNTVEKLDELEGAAVAGPSLSLASFVTDHVAELVTVVDRAGIIRYVNQQSCDVLGYRPEELLGHHLSTIQAHGVFSPEALAARWQLLCEKGGYGLVTELRRRDGSPISLEIKAHYVEFDGEPCNLVFARDISEAVRREADLKKSQQQFLMVMEQACDAIWLMYGDGRVFYANPSACRLLGLEEGNWAHPHLQDYLAPGERSALRETLAQLRRQDIVRREWPLRKSSGALAEVDLSFQRLPDGNILALGRDLSAERAAQRAVARERAHLRTLVETIPDLVWLKDINGVYLACNPVFERFVGRPEGAVLGATDDDLLPAELAALFRARDQEVIASGNVGVHEESVVFADDGHVALLETIKTPMRDSAGQIVGVLGIARDISRLRATETDLKASIREARCLHEVYRITEGDSLPLPAMLDALVKAIPAGWRASECLCVAVHYQGQESRFGPCREASTEYRFPFTVAAGDEGCLCLGYLRPPGRDAVTAFLPGEMALAEAIATRLGSALRHRHGARALKVREEIYRAIVDQAVDGIALVDAAHQSFVEFNGALCQGLGYDREAFARLTLADLLVDTSPGGLLSRLQQGEMPKTRQDVAVRRADGEIRMVNLAVHGICVQEQAYLATLWRDVTERRQDEARLRASEQALNEAQRVAQLGSWQWDPVSGRITWSREALRILRQCRPEEEDDEEDEGGAPLDANLPVAAFLNLVHGDDREAVKARWAGLARGEHWDQEHRLGEGSRLRWVRLRARAGGAGSIQALVGSIQDITERKELDLELARHRDHLESLVAERTRELELAYERQRLSDQRLAAMFRLSQGADAMDEGELLEAGLAIALQLTGSTRGRILRNEVTGPVTAACLPPLDVATEENEAPLRVSVPGQEDQTLVLAGRPGGYGEAERQEAGLLMDDLWRIVLRRRAELALAEAKLQAERANQAKTMFLANMSHEIRTPLNAILGLTHLLQRSTLGTQQRGQLNQVSSSAQHLLAIINDILDISKIEAGRLNLESVAFSLESVLQRVQGQIAQKVAEKGLELLFDVDPAATRQPLLGDPLRLQQVLLNYLGNAVKFTETGNVLVRVYPLAHPAQGPTPTLWRFEVRDTGIGIAPVDQPRLFQSFVQADGSITRRYGGTGLGLAICQRLVSLMGGEVGLSSAPGQGSTFWFTARLEPAPEETGGGVARAMAPARALVVDDIPLAREVLARLLRTWGWQVSEAAGGPEAIEQVAAAQEAGQPFSVVFLDWEMPDLDGLSTARQILGAYPSPDGAPRCVLLAPLGRDVAEVDVAGDTLAGILVKPVTPDTVQQCLVALGSGKRVLPDGEREMAATARLRRACLGRRILLAEDHAINRDVAIALLGELGLTVDVAANGAEAVSRARTGAYDLVFMDMQMPVMDGLMATQAIRQCPELANLPIIAMTANAFAEDRRRCLAAGMNDHLAKPVSPALLREVLGRWLNPPETPSQPGPLGPTGEERTGDSAVLAAWAAALAALPGVDLVQGLRSVGGKVATYQRLLNHFCQDHRQTVARLDSIVSRRSEWDREWDQDWNREAVLHLAHLLKGSAAVLGLVDLQELAGQVEQCVRGGGQDGAGWAELHGRCQDLAAAFVRLDQGIAGLSGGGAGDGGR